MSATTWGRFDWQDPFLLESQLTEEERMVRDTAAQYGQQRLAPRVREAYRQESTDAAIFTEMGELGLLGPTIQGNLDIRTSNGDDLVLLGFDGSVLGNARIRTGAGADVDGWGAGAARPPPPPSRPSRSCPAAPPS